LMKRWGVCGNPITGYPDAVYSRITQLGWLRCLVLDDSTWQGMYDQVPQDTSIAAVITGQSGPLANDFWGDGWRERYTAYITAFCEKYYRRVRLIEFANEWDMWDNADRAEKAAELAMVGTQICKQYGILGVLGSVAGSDWQAQLARACKVLDKADAALGYTSVHGFAFHPYMSYVERDRGVDSYVVPGNGMKPSDGWERLSDKVLRAISIAGGRPCAITEFGIKVGDAGGADKHGLYVHAAFEDELSKIPPTKLIMATLFCWVDSNGAPDERGNAAFGLISEGGMQRPAYNAFTYQAQNAPVVDVPVSTWLSASMSQTADTGGNPDPQEATPQPAGGTPTPVTPTDGPGTQVVPVVPVSRILTPADAHGIRWRAIVPSAPYNHDFGFERAWRHPDNAWWGSPVTEGEYTLDDGRPVRVFANAVVAYNGGDDTTEVL
jgi:hypothetical protein